jgi:hypothetical protein
MLRQEKEMMEKEKSGTFVTAIQCYMKYDGVIPTIKYIYKLHD